jgi:uncharacterized protein
MSNAPQVRRQDKLMTDDRLHETLARGFCGRLATVSKDGSPYCLPLLYVWQDSQIFVHNANAPGHLLTNVGHEKRVCFEIDEPGEVFDYGRFECDSSVAYRSVIAFGTIRIVTALEEKHRFCEALMAKYRKKDTPRPKGFFPRINDITVYAITVARMTGKETPLPALSEQWPAQDQTKTPNAKPPA